MSESTPLPPSSSDGTVPTTSSPAVRSVRSDDPALPDAGPGVVAAPLAEQVFDTLRGWIIDGHLPPGARLRVRDVAEAVGTSVMPVREAIRRLVEVGLAVHEPYKGARVLGLDVDELEQAYDARILLEGECARRGASAATPDVADRMQEHWLKLERAAEAGEITVALECDENLLGELYAAAGNDVLCEIIRGLWARCRPYKVIWASSTTGDGGSGIWHFKPDLIAAVRANDGVEAEEVLRTSYEVAKSALRETLAGHAPA